MRDDGKRNLLGVEVSVCDYEGATAAIIAAARERRPFAVSCAAVHGVMEAALHAEHRHRINHLDLVTPDGQPVRWGLNLLHGAKLADRVYGPNLTLRIAEAAAAEGLPVYLYGSRAEITGGMAEQLTRRYPGLQVAGWEPSRFGSATPEECDVIADRIRATGARLCFVGLGCPRQEVWASALSERLGMPTLCVGTAFDFHAAGIDAPAWMQRVGLEWVWRLAREPRRLWRRYLIMNPAYLALLTAQLLRLWRPDTSGREPDERMPVPA